MYTILLSNDLTILHLSLQLIFFSPLLPMSMFVSFEQKTESSPLLVTNVKKEISFLWPKSNNFYKYLSLL